MPKGGGEEEGRERRERGKEKKKREEDPSQPAAGATWFGVASEASAILGVSNELFGFSMERPKHWLHSWPQLPVNVLRYAAACVCDSHEPTKFRPIGSRIASHEALL